MSHNFSAPLTMLVERADVDRNPTTAGYCARLSEVTDPADQERASTMLLTAHVANRDFPEGTGALVERRRLWKDIRPESSGNPGSFCQVAWAFCESQTGWWS